MKLTRVLGEFSHDPVALARLKHLEARVPDPDRYFAEDFYRQVAKHDGPVAFIKPADFEQYATGLTKSSRYEDDMARLRGKLAGGNWKDPPRLGTFFEEGYDPTDVLPRISSHDGRHRMRYAAEENIPEVPVLLSGEEGLYAGQGQTLPSSTVFDRLRGNGWLLDQEHELMSPTWKLLPVSGGLALGGAALAPSDANAVPYNHTLDALKELAQRQREEAHYIKPTGDGSRSADETISDISSAYPNVGRFLKKFNDVLPGPVSYAGDIYSDIAEPDRPQAGFWDRVGGSLGTALLALPQVSRRAPISYEGDAILKALPIKGGRAADMVERALPSAVDTSIADALGVGFLAAPGEVPGYAGGGAIKSAAESGLAHAKRWYNDIPGLYSRLESAVSDLVGRKNGTMQAEGWLSYLTKHPDVNNVEIKATGLEQALAADPKRKWTAEELGSWLENNRLPISKTDLTGGFDRDASGAFGAVHEGPPTEYKSYTIKGPKQGYTESLYHWDAPKGPNVPEAVAYPSDPIYSAPHYSGGNESNLGFHTRQSLRPTPQGGLAHHVDEVQSDWAQAMRDKGTYDPGRPWEVFNLETDDVFASFRDREPAMRDATLRAEQRLAALPPRDMDALAYLQQRGFTDRDLRQIANGFGSVNHPPDILDAIARYHAPLPPEFNRTYPQVDFVHAGSLGKVPYTPLGEEARGVPLYARAGLNKQLYDAAANPDISHFTWTPGEGQWDVYPGLSDKQKAGMKVFYDQKVPKEVAWNIQRVGVDPKSVIGTADIVGPANGKLFTDIFRHFGDRQWSPFYQQELHPEAYAAWERGVSDLATQMPAMSDDLAYHIRTQLPDAAEEHFSSGGDPNARENFMQSLRSLKEKMLDQVQGAARTEVPSVEMTPELREAILRRGLPIMGAGGVSALLSNQPGDEWQNFMDGGLVR